MLRGLIWVFLLPAYLSAVSSLHHHNKYRHSALPPLAATKIEYYDIAVVSIPALAPSLPLSTQS